MPKDKMEEKHLTPYFIHPAYSRSLRMTVGGFRLMYGLSDWVRLNYKSHLKNTIPSVSQLQKLSGFSVASGAYEPLRALKDMGAIEGAGKCVCLHFLKKKISLEKILLASPVRTHTNTTRELINWAKEADYPEMVTFLKSPDTGTLRPLAEVKDYLKKHPI